MNLEASCGAAVPFTAVFLVISHSGCEHGCDKAELWSRPAGEERQAVSNPPPMSVTDCPDGLGKCDDGLVSVSRLASLRSPCHGPIDECSCPWERIGSCPNGCAAEGVEVVIEREHAALQLCAPTAIAPPFSRRVAPDSVPAPDCEEGQRYRCVDSVVVDCDARTVGARCIRGCVAPGASVDDDGAGREAAFAILCLR